MAIPFYIFFPNPFFWQYTSGNLASMKFRMNAWMDECNANKFIRQSHFFMFTCLEDHKTMLHALL